MKIAFVGKGGSGKTTTSTLFARYLASQGKRVLFIDGDINQHAYESLGIAEDEVKSVKKIGEDQSKLKEYFAGQNPRVIVSEMLKTTPVGSGSKLSTVDEFTQKFAEYTVNVGSITFMGTGAFDEEDLGVACYHSKTGAIELILNHIVDRDDEFIIVDMTAGADAFASGLFTRFDTTFLVAEPTLKSLDVYQQYITYAKDHEVDVQIIGNKIEDEDDVKFIQDQLDKEPLGYLGYSRFVRNMEKGKFLDIDQYESENLQVFKNVEKYVSEKSSDYQKFYDQMVEFHIRNCKSWANDLMGKDLTIQIDPDFDYVDALKVFYSK